MDTKTDKYELLPKQREDLLHVLKVRFEKNMNRHKSIDWNKVESSKIMVAISNGRNGWRT